MEEEEQQDNTKESTFQLGSNLFGNVDEKGNEHQISKTHLVLMLMRIYIVVM